MSSEVVKSKKPGRKPGIKNKLKKIKFKSSGLTIREINEINTSMYHNRTKFMALYEKYGEYDSHKFDKLVKDIASKKAKVTNYELAVIRIIQDITSRRIDDPDKYANMFGTVLQFLSGDITGNVTYKVAPIDILQAYKDFVATNKKTPKDFALDLDNWVMFMCSDPSLWNDEAFRVTKTIGEWMLKINLHHASSVKAEKLNTLLDGLKSILVDRVGTQHPESFSAISVDLQALLQTLDLVPEESIIKVVK